MNREIRDKWCAKLRDPTTKQTTNYLINKFGQCCLGVLSEVMGVKMNPEHTRQYDYTEWTESYSDGDFNVSAEERAKEFDEELPPEAFAKSIGLTYENMMTLSRMNDGGENPRTVEGERKTFPEIADYIEENY